MRILGAAAYEAMHLANHDFLNTNSMWKTDKLVEEWVNLLTHIPAFDENRMLSTDSVTILNSTSEVDTSWSNHFLDDIHRVNNDNLIRIAY